jgi:hypothetical protein
VYTVSKIFFISGVILAFYSVFSRFYGEPSIAFTLFKSINLLIAANTLILISIAANQFLKK